MPIDNAEAIQLVLRICEGHKPSVEEKSLLSNLEELDLSRRQISTLDGLSGLTNLRSLNLSNTQVGTPVKTQDNREVSSLNGLRKLTALRSLNLAETRVASLEEISKLTELKSLNLGRSRINSLDGLDRLTNLQFLDLTYTQVSSLECVCGLTNLKSLNLYGTQIASIDGLGNLKNLQELYLGETQVASLEELGELTNLRVLDLCNTQVNSLKGLSGLPNLRSLNLTNTQIGSFEVLSELTNLRSLNLANTQISSLKVLSGLTNLRSLNLTNTQISSLEVLSGLTNLRSLNLTNTQISSLEAIASLPSLSVLNISNVWLDRIPKQFVDKDFRFITGEEFGRDSHCVYMKNVQLCEQPVSLFSQRRELIEAYYQEEQVSVNEAKVIFLGDGGVGKTYTIYRIEHDGKEPKETETTPGVSITTYKREGKATINFWDFGGQEIMCSMYRCFLTERACCVITVSNRYSDVTRQARRWLKNIESFAPNSKVILAVNCWEGVFAWDLDRRRLMEEFPNLVDVVEYSAITYEGIDRLSRRIESAVDALHSVSTRFPKSWMGIMNRIRDMRDESGARRNYITREKYLDICKEAGLTSESISMWLLEWFNDLGVCFSYHKDDKDDKDDLELANYIILNPEWLTNAFHIIVNNGRQFALQGLITRERIFELLNRPQKCVVKGLGYDKDESRFILEVMRKFRSSYKVDDELEFAPDLCPNVTPVDLRPQKYLRRVRCEVRYDYLPVSVVHRLMTDYALRLNLGKCWLKGLCIDQTDVSGLLAVCDMGRDDDVLRVDVYQVKDADVLKPKSPRSLLRDLLNKLENINDKLNLKSTTWIGSDGAPEAFFPLSFLLKAVHQGKRTISSFTSRGGYAEYDVRQLVGQVFDAAELSEVLAKLNLLGRPSSSTFDRREENRNMIKGKNNFYITDNRLSCSNTELFSGTKRLLQTTLFQILKIIRSFFGICLTFVFVSCIK